MGVDRTQAIFTWGLSCGCSEKVTEPGVIVKAFSLAKRLPGPGKLQQLELEQFGLLGDLSLSVVSPRGVR